MLVTQCRGALRPAVLSSFPCFSFVYPFSKSSHSRFPLPPSLPTTPSKLPPPRVRRESAAGPSRPSFRPRPIDLAKPLPIIKTSKDLRHEDDVVVNRALPTIASGVDPSEEEERHLQQALLASVFGAKAPAEIPVPVVSRVEPPSIAGLFNRTTAYLLFDRADQDLVDDGVEYDADYKDTAFVTSTPGIDLELLERGMDALEKHQGRLEATTLQPYSSVKSTLADLLPTVSEPVRRDLHAHWHRRRVERGTAFLRIYQPAPDPKNHDPAVAFRPRERDAVSGVARRMNTYDNYRKALVLRAELEQLADLLSCVINRERIKAEALAVQLFRQRLQATAEGGVRMDAANRSVFVGEVEPVVVYGEGLANAVIVPCRGLDLPNDIRVVSRKMGSEKLGKKSRRKSRPIDKKLSKDAFAAQTPDVRVNGSGLPPAVDTFGFDEHGNKFLKHMRYFAGGFMNYGVSPYDHRIFAAASERNTVRVLPREPSAVTFPSANVAFGHFRERRNRGGKVGPQSLTAQDICKDILVERYRSEPFRADEASPPKRRRTIRARGRVGRGGRIFLDRVVFEKETGVRAASYPASVDIGGVYTAGIPFHEARKVARQVVTGAMGEISKLDGGVELERADGEKNELVALAQRLLPPLKPIVNVGSGLGMQPDIVDFWPRRRKGGGSNMDDNVTDGDQYICHKEGVSSREEQRRLPAFAPRTTALVAEV